MALETRSSAPRNATPPNAQRVSQASKRKAHLIHHIPGRTRFRVSGRHSDGEFYDSITSRLRRLDRVSDVEVNPATGSVMVLHDGDIDGLIEAASGSELSELLEFVLQSPPVARKLRSEMLEIDRALTGWSGGEVDLGTVTALGLLGVAALHLVRGTQPLIAVSLAWYAVELLRRSGSGETTAVAR